MILLGAHSKRKKLVGSYYAVCWVFVQLDVLSYRLSNKSWLDLIMQCVGSLHLIIDIYPRVISNRNSVDA